MKLLPTAWILAGALAGHSASAGEAPVQTEFDATFENESRVIGTTGEESLRVTTEIGIQAIPFKVLRRIEAVEEGVEGERKGKIKTGRPLLFLLRNGDSVEGIPMTPSLALKGEKGPVTLRFDKIVSVDVVAFTHSDPESLAESLQVHFTFEDEVGAVITNQTRKTRVAKLMEGKRSDGTVVLDGRDDHVFLDNEEAFENIELFTVSIWMKLKSFGPGGYGNEHGYLVNKGNAMWWNSAWSLGYSKKSGAGKKASKGPNPALFTIGSEHPGGRADCRLASKTKLATGRWYHLAGTFDGKTARLYINGHVECEKVYSGKLRRDQAPLLLGGAKLGGREFGNHFTTDATIDNFRLYNRALSAGEVRALHRLEAR